MHYRTKTIRRQPIINGGINVEIGNPSYNMYEVGHDHSEGGLLASDFTVNAEKVIFFLFLVAKPLLILCLAKVLTF